ncbi:histone-lysine N-methyltransferase SUV39H2-like isoform X1 [Dermacentor silvarum]|uniref:histone-lysine N-methyltransferase SUV39H2-like isoform X1 n=1 Tax=Dermacentor silvarum TaxID=543639 RepID=UPI00189BD185|nr:histone-lysine N-methyltransferase SUV39H2-like isoform X1 [Dermacentor silvarum]
MSSPSKLGSRNCVSPTTFYNGTVNGCTSQLRTSSPTKRSPRKVFNGDIANDLGVQDGSEVFSKYPRLVLRRLTDEEVLAATGYSQWNESAPVQEYEVEDVLEIKKEKGQTWFLIKWKGWSDIYNSWETEDAVQNCMALVLECCVRTNSSYKNNLIQRAVRLVCNAQDPDIAVLSKLAGFTVPDNGFVRKQDISEMRKQVLRLSAHRPGQMTRIVKAFGSWEVFVATVQERCALADTIRKWETYIQVASGTYEANTTKPLLRVENYVDQEPPPPGFVYIRDFLPGPGVSFPDDPKMGCSCENCYVDRKGCCPAYNDVKFAYTASGTLSAPFGSPIFECNRLCRCDMNCPNRVVQRGCKIPLTIFRTTNGRGWGVRTEQRISKGTFVMEYLGQVITDEEAEKRGKWYDDQGTTYLFDLDYHLQDDSMDQGTMYTVDAGTYGNIAHFVNHSCEPNMAVCMVWINNLDLRMPRLAFFTNRDIYIHEELTVDYKMSCGATEATPDSKKSHPHSKIRIPCKCGAKKCRRFLN